MRPHGERGVEQQHALFSPACEVAAFGHGCAEVLLYLLEDVLQRRRERHTVVHGEAESLCLSLLMVRILPNDDHLHLVEGTEVEGVEDEVARRIACGGAIFVAHKTG